MSVVLSITVVHSVHRLNSPFSCFAGEFDVYTMESALPKIDWDTIEAHLQATKEEERRVSENYFITGTVRASAASSASS